MIETHPRLSLTMFYLCIVIAMAVVAYYQPLSVALPKFIFGWLIFLPICIGSAVYAARNPAAKRATLRLGIGLMVLSGLIIGALKLYVG